MPSRFDLDTAVTGSDEFASADLGSQWHWLREDPGRWRLSGGSLVITAQSGDLDRARQIDAEITPVYEATSVTTNPIPLKAALEMLGLCANRLRLPLVPADAEQRAAIKAGLDAAGVAISS